MALLLFIVGSESALYVVSVENLVSLVASGLSEILVVDLLDRGVLVGLAEIHLSVSLVEHRRAESSEIDRVANRRGLERLTAAVDASARAAHDLDEIDLLLAVLDSREQLLGVLGTRSDSDADGLVAELIGRALDRSGSADVVKVDLFERLAEDDLSRGTES